MYNAHSVSLLIAHTCKGARIYCTLQFSINPFFFSFTIEIVKKIGHLFPRLLPCLRESVRMGEGEGGLRGRGGGRQSCGVSCETLMRALPA